MLNDKAEINIGNPMDGDDYYIMIFTDEDECSAMWKIYEKVFVYGLNGTG